MNDRLYHIPTITVFTSRGGPLTKRFTLQHDGAIQKESLATLSAGQANCVAAPSATALAQILKHLRPFQAIATGRPKAGTAVSISTKAKRQKGQVTRSLDHFGFVSDAGWLLWDYDDKTMPPAISQRVADLGGPLEAFFHVWPEARNGAYVIRPSSSDGVTAPNSGPIESAGLHGFFLVADVSKSKAILETLERRAWAEGLAWIALSKSGSKLRRSIVDTAVGSPERLIFEAAPILIAPVTRTPSAAIVHDSGAPLDAPTLPADLLSLAKRAETDARQTIDPEAAEAEDAHVQSRADDLVARTGVGLSAARQSIRQMMKGETLADDHWLQQRGGRWVRVGDLLDNPANDRVSMPDPIEGIAYGADKATLMLMPRAEHPEEHPRLISHAHGVRTVYRFARYATPRDPKSGAQSAASRTYLPKPAELPNGRKGTLIDAMHNATREGALSVAVAVAHQMQFNVPLLYTPKGIAATIAEHMDGLLTAAEINAVQKRVEWLQNKRRAEVFKRTIITDDAAKNHDKTTVTTLEDVDVSAVQGVLLVKAPMAAGKTQLIGSPFIAAAKAAGGDVMAIAHRVTLIAELSRRLGLPNYQAVTEGEIDAAGGIAVCLPSIARTDIVAALYSPQYVFIDEVAQVLQFLSEPICASGFANNQDVYERLRQIIRDADAVVVADADLDMRTLRFLEMCRPDERFKIVEMLPQPTGRRAVVHPNGEGALQTVGIELEAGGKVWLSCESYKRAEALADMYANRGFRVLCITAHNKKDAAQKAFLENADAESREYDLVVSSPAISSGISIEHRDNPHYTLGAYLGSGTATRPEDAKQQLGRVRYLTRYVLGITRTNLTGGQNVASYRKGAADAAALEGLNIEWTDFDGFVTGIKADAANAQADFVAGLWYHLEAAGWLLEPAPETDSTDTRRMAKAATEQHKQDRLDALLSAQPMSSHQAMLIKDMQRNTKQEIRWEAHRIRLTLGRQELTAFDIEFWDEGRALDRIARFEDLMNVKIDLPDEVGTMAQRQFRIARRRLYASLFNGVDACAPIHPKTAEMILDRVMTRPEAHVAVGIVGPKYRARYRGKNGNLDEIIRPKQTGREVADILKRCGLVVNSKQERIVTKPAPLVNKRDCFVTKQDRGRTLTVDADSFKYMAEILERRKTFDIDVAVAPTDRTPPVFERRESDLHSAGRQSRAIHFDHCGKPLPISFKQPVQCFAEKPDT